MGISNQSFDQAAWDKFANSKEPKEYALDPQTLNPVKVKSGIFKNRNFQTLLPVMHKDNEFLQKVAELGLKLKAANLSLEPSHQKALLGSLARYQEQSSNFANKKEIASLAAELLDSRLTSKTLGEKSATPSMIEPFSSSDEFETSESEGSASRLLDSDAALSSDFDEFENSTSEGSITRLLDSDAALSSDFEAEVSHSKLSSKYAQVPATIQFTSASIQAAKTNALLVAKEFDDHRKFIDVYLQTSSGEPTSAQKRVEAELGQAGLEILNCLSEGTTQSTKARSSFLDYLQHITLNFDPALTSSRESVTMQTLIGGKVRFEGKEITGLDLYKAAIAEEMQSLEFRAAVLLEAANIYPGQTWQSSDTDKPKAIFEGGVSAAGKSYVQKQLIAELSQLWHDPSRPIADHKGNLVISIDGGIEREVSQMRNMLLGVALQKGFSDISDLHSHTKLDVKGKLEKAASQLHLNVILPLTFANPMEIQKMPNFKALGYEVIFTEVKGAIDASTGKEDPTFKRTVRLQGESRAKFQGKHAPRLSMNGKRACESKKYQPKYFKAGKLGTSAAKKYYQEFIKGPTLTVRNDLVFVKFENGTLLPAENHDKQGLVKLTQRQYKAFIKAHPADKPITPESLASWLKTASPELTKIMVEVKHSPQINLEQPKYPSQYALLDDS